MADIGLQAQANLGMAAATPVTANAVMNEKPTSASGSQSGSGTGSASQSSLPMRKRKQEVIEGAGASAQNDVEKKIKTDPAVATGSVTLPSRTQVQVPANDIIMLAKESAAHVVAAAPSTEADLKPITRAPMSKAREVRLEQNRKAARESRRRKKIMIEELQRSVVFFSRANSTLKQQNDELQRMLLSAQARITSFEKGEVGAPGNAAQTQENLAKKDELVRKDTRDAQAQQAVASAQAQAQAAQAAATQAMFQNQGFPPAAARAAAQTFVAGPPPNDPNAVKTNVDGVNAQGQVPVQVQAPTNQMANSWPIMMSLANSQQQTNDKIVGQDKQVNVNVAPPASATVNQQQIFQNALFAMQQLTQMQAQGIQSQVPVQQQQQLQQQQQQPQQQQSVAMNPNAMFQNAFVQMPMNGATAAGPNDQTRAQGENFDMA